MKTITLLEWHPTAPKSVLIDLCPTIHFDFPMEVEITEDRSDSTPSIVNINGHSIGTGWFVSNDADDNTHNDNIWKIVAESV